MPIDHYSFFFLFLTSSHGIAIQTQLYSVPPWACAFAFAMAIATISDHLKHRFAFALFPISLAFSGFSILLAVHDNPKVQYAALFLAVMGCYSAMPVIACWFNLNRKFLHPPTHPSNANDLSQGSPVGGHRRRAVGIAWQIGFGSIGGIVATYSFISKDAPRYTKGHAISLGFICLSAVSCVAYYIAITTENRKRDNGQSKYSHATEEERKMLGDLHPEYRYLG